MPHFDSADFKRVLAFFDAPRSSASSRRTHCCQHMTIALNYTCSHGHDRFECPDQLLYYCPQFDEYGLLIHDGGASYILITHCPWCGVTLPQPKRDLWFDALESMGFDAPLDQDIPEEFKSDGWYRRTT